MMDKKSLQEKAESDLLWQMAMVRMFKLTELRVRFGAIMATPAIEIKKLALSKIIKEYKALEEE